MSESGLTLAALGGPQTFNGMAAARLAACYPQFGRIVYFPTSEATITAAIRGEVDAACGQEQTSLNGFHAGMQARISAPDSLLHVIAEISQRYRCSLLGKPMTALGAVRHVLGHDGSIAHSRRWLEASLPGVTIEVVTSSSLGAARAVLESDGSVASVGNPDVAREFGLQEIVKDIDDGAIVNYWAVSCTPRFSEAPERLAIAWRCGEGSPLTAFIGVIAETGFALQAIYPRSTGQGLYEYDYVFRFRGAGRLDDVCAALARYPSTRLAGAWTPRATPL
jgi:prephenate dehydratase